MTSFDQKTSGTESALWIAGSVLCFPLGVVLSALLMLVGGAFILGEWPLGTVDAITGDFTPVIPFQAILFVIVPHVLWALAAAGGTAAFAWAWQHANVCNSYSGPIVLSGLVCATLLGAWLWLPRFLDSHDLMLQWDSPFLTPTTLSAAFLAGVVVTIFKVK